MATELFSLCGYVGWRSRAGGVTRVIADFDGVDWSFEHADTAIAERAFYRFARRARIRWLLRRLRIFRQNVVNVWTIIGATLTSAFGAGMLRRTDGDKATWNARCETT